MSGVSAQIRRRSGLSKLPLWQHDIHPNGRSEAFLSDVRLSISGIGSGIERKSSLQLSVGTE